MRLDRSEVYVPRKTLQKVDRPPLLHHSVQAALREFIAANHLRPGDPLPSEGDLANQLGVSRNSVREAVKALESTGVVETRRGSGVFVASFSFETLLSHLPYAMMEDLRELSDLLQVRQVLETGLIGVALRAMTPERVSDLRRILDAMRERAQAGSGFPEQDRAFHAALLAGTGNGVVLGLLDIFWLAWNRAAETVDIRDPDPLLTYRDHVAIVDAVEAGDEAAAADALRRHYDGILRRLSEPDAEPRGANATGPRKHEAGDR